MKGLLLFAGTTEGRKLSECLAEAQISHTVCVATEYGEIVLKQHPLIKVHRGRMCQEEIERFIEENDFAAVVDATHPFAQNITHNIKAAIEHIKSLGIPVPYLRLKRDGMAHRESDICYFETNEACKEALEKTEGNILLTTGSKELAEYCISEKVKRRLYVRVLPGMESLSLCTEQGIYGKQVIAMQGPFSVEMNEAIIRQYQISYLVTKESGTAGGYQEKLEAAKRTGTQVFVIGCPEEEEGYLFFEICAKLEKICGRNILPEGQSIQNGFLEIVLAGIGMGDTGCLTKEAEKAIDEADILLGAERLIENFGAKTEKHPFYQAKQVIPYLRKVQAQNVLEGNTLSGERFSKSMKVVILFSGDSGFYSGCQSLYAALKKEVQEGGLQADVHILPGISSIAYLASCIGENYHDALICSLHGKKLCNLARRIKNNPKTFLLTSGVGDINWLGEQLTEASMPGCEIITGYQLSYEEQRIDKHTPLECRALKEEGLYTCFVKNPYAVERKLTHGMPDDEFIRDRVPMTKEEVREVSICKLRLQEKSVVYDIGSGTGSIAVEIASLSNDIQVYAVEQKKEAAALLRKNKEKFGLRNISVLEEAAPDGLAALPMATHAFIGGSSGRLQEILAALRRINPKMRVVINAVSIETFCEIREVLSEYSIEREDIVQLQVNRVKKFGKHHLMQSENPVWICSFDFTNGN